MLYTSVKNNIKKCKGVKMNKYQLVAFNSYIIMSYWEGCLLNFEQ